MLYGFLIIELASKLHNLGTDKDIGAGELFPQSETIQRGASTQSHIRLPTCEGTTREVHGYVSEGQPLALVDGDGPSQP